MGTAPGVERRDAAEAAELLRRPDAAEHLSVATGCAVLVIDEDDRAPGFDLGTPHPPCVTVVVSRQPESGLVRWADVVVADDDEAAPVVDGVVANPGASVALTQLLRTTGRLPVRDALMAEPWVYGLLQSGQEFARWLAGHPRRTTTDSGPTVLTCVDDDRTTIVLNRPHVRNALNIAMRDELADVLRVLAQSEGPIELRGAGSCFCAGGTSGSSGRRRARSRVTSCVRRAARPRRWLASHRA